ncbi:MAG: A/G-specific adenine glycosylase [Acidobacteriota bacterium]|jgi:A/G-specific adenine glycosylase
MARHERPGDGAFDAAAVLPHELTGAMLDWYREMHRDLPWRRTRDPYAILVSEIMLQQTRVETVLGRYESFLERFPTLADLAAAPLDDVLAEWSGLGYYRRPRALHALARVVVEEHGGELPSTLDGLLALPGLGPYTAAAVGAIAYGLPALSVDGNVGRILCRIAGVEDDFRRAPVRRRLESLAADALRANDPGELNQAIMELGARVCTPRAPRCDDCPAASWCEAHALGIEELIPPSKKEPVHAVTEHAAVIERDGRYLLLRGQRPTLVADMWEFPTLDSRLARHFKRSVEKQTENGASKKALRRYLEELGWPVRLDAELGEIRHGMTNRRITCRVHAATLSDGNEDRPSKMTNRAVEAAVAEPDPGTSPAAEHGWFTPAEIVALPLAASARKTLSELLGTPLPST